MTPRRWLLGALPLAILLAAPLAILSAGGFADARPGGGHTSSGTGRSSSGGGFSSGRSSSGGGFSSSGHSSSSSGSYYSGGGDLNGGIVVLGLLLVAVVVAAAVAASSAKTRGWTSSLDTMPDPDATPDADDAPPAKLPAADLGPLMECDPGFSRAVFEDFVFELYAAAHRERGDSKLLRLQPYLSPAALDQLGTRGVAPQQVVIGTLQIEDHSAEPPGRDQIRVRIEATHIGARAPVYVVEHWVFSRSVDAKSRPPERTRTWPCPNCGAPWQPSPTRQCAHCGQAMEVGKFDWCVEDIAVESEARALASLTGTIAEYGNDLPTVVDPAAHAMLGQISADDPQVTFETLQPRILLVYQQLNTTWNARDLTPVRGFVTAALRNYLAYWLHEYEHQGLHNTLADARISEMDLARSRATATTTRSPSGSSPTASIPPAMPRAGSSAARPATGGPTPSTGPSCARRRGAVRSPPRRRARTAGRRSPSATSAIVRTAASRSRTEASTGPCRRSSRTTTTPVDRFPRKPRSLGPDLARQNRLEQER